MDDQDQAAQGAVQTILRGSGVEQKEEKPVKATVIAQAEAFTLMELRVTGISHEDMDHPLYHEQPQKTRMQETGINS